ncbi:nitrous oxide reductase accessory protein NosL [bacterium]|nr:nitrous oxide reductase accessory protein NosL [bacterium]MBU1994564.1 nitrous oxide reductase accessory protein NosL [bacterium]
MRKIVIGMILVSTFLFGFSMEYNKETACLVRNFKVHKGPQWVAKIELTNEKEVFFSSPKSMFEFYFVPGKWFDVGVKSEKDFKEILVTDFNTLKPIKAKSAFFVYGSNVTSPAGDDLVPFDSYKDAQNFAKKHNGKRVFSFKEVSDPLIRLLNGRI